MSDKFDFSKFTKNFDPKRMTQMNNRLVGVGLLFYLGMNSFYKVNAGERAVKFNILTGLSNKHHFEGYHLKIPFIERPIVMYCRAKTFDIACSTPNRDLQMVELKARVIYKPDPDQIDQIYKRLGNDYVQKVLTSTMNECIRGVIAQYNAQQLYGQREIVSDQIKKNLAERTRPFHIMVEDLSLMDMHFSRTFEQAVEEKQIAQQAAERAKFTVEKAMQEKKSSIIKADADAQSISLIGEQIKANPAYLQIQRIEVARNISQILAGAKNRVMLPSDTLMVNLNDKSYDMKSATGDH